MTRFPDDVPVLTDGVVTLRAHRASDAQGSLEQGRDPLSQEWTTVPVPYTRADAEQYVTEIIPAGWAEDRWAFAVEAPDDEGRVRWVGTVELRSEGARRAEIAYGAHPWARGRGLVQRALTLLLDWGFAERGLETVIWWASRGNWASRRTAWRLGFSCDGTIDRWLPHRGELVDAWVGVLHADTPRRPRTPWLDLPRLEHDGVLLRGFAAIDAREIREACTDGRTRHWLATLPDPYTDAEALAYVDSRTEQQATGGGLTWAVADPRTQVALGAVSLFDLEAGQDAELGFWTHPRARGRGVMTAACRAVVRHAFSPAPDGGLGLLRLRARTAVDNAASRHVLTACGFTQVAQERAALRLGDGSLSDAIGYDLLVDDVA